MASQTTSSTTAGTKAAEANLSATELAKRELAKGTEPFLFSVVTAVYNTEDYLAEAIESVLGQTIGFQYIQLVLVDDGSKDSSGAICDRYEAEHPENIVVIHQQNSGVSAARNAGIDASTSRWINCLDSDDKWSPDAFEQALRFFAAHPEVAVVSEQMIFFGATTGPHMLNYKFKTTRVIDIDEEPSCIQLAMNSAFIARSKFEGRRFDTNLSVSEDFALIDDIIMEEKQLGVTSKGIYHYRRREDDSSAINLSNTNISWYVDTPKGCFTHLFDLSKQRYGQVIPYIQWCVMYDLQWRRHVSPAGVLSPEDAAEYKQTIVNLLHDIDDQIIVDQKHIDINFVLYFMALKYGCPADDLMASAKLRDGYIWVMPPESSPNRPAEPIRTRSYQRLSKKVQIDFVRHEEGRLAIEGTIDTLNDCNEAFPRVSFQVNGTPIEKLQGASMCYLRRYDRNSITAFDGIIFPRRGFKLVFPWNGTSTVKLSGTIHLGDASYPAGFMGAKFCGLSNFVRHPYCVRDGLFLRRTVSLKGKRRTLVIKPASSFAETLAEKEYQSRIAKHKDPKIRALLPYRQRYFENRKKYAGKRIWLISDRIVKAGDNGEALFRYLHDNPIEGVLPIFAIREDSPDFERLKQYGEVVAYDTDAYRDIFLQADKIISSAADEYIITAFDQPQRDVMKNLYHSDYVFLQHGITKDDVSDWLNRYKKDIKLLVTCAPRERDSFLQGEKYSYSPDVVKLTGFPRHDALVSAATTRDAKRLIWIMPTWRKWLTGKLDTDTGERQRNKHFEESPFFQFYNGLIHSERFNDLLERYDFRANFMLHPAFIQETDKFSGTNRVAVVESCDYTEAFLDAACMITDYSSVAMDYALLKRPLIYAQFDADQFFGTHWDTGYFSYPDDGFGPITTTLDETIDAIEEILASGCTMPEMYRQRADDFFFTPEKTRCQLVTEGILALGSHQH